MSDLHNDDHHDHDHDHDQSHDTNARRDFLKQTAVASMILGVGIVATTPVAAGPLKARSAHEAQSLLMMARTLFPHDFLGDSYYMNIVNSIDAKAAAARAGTVQTTVAGPVAGVGAQPVMVPVAPVKTVPAGMARLIVVAGDAVKLLLSTVT